jgi:hypothetical protein
MRAWMPKRRRRANRGNSNSSLDSNQPNSPTRTAMKLSPTTFAHVSNATNIPSTTTEAALVAGTAGTHMETLPETLLTHTPDQHQSAQQSAPTTTTPSNSKPAVGPVRRTHTRTSSYEENLPTSARLQLKSIDGIKISLCYLFYHCSFIKFSTYRLQSTNCVYSLGSFSEDDEDSEPTDTEDDGDEVFDLEKALGLQIVIADLDMPSPSRPHSWSSSSDSTPPPSPSIPPLMAAAYVDQRTAFPIPPLLSGNTDSAMSSTHAPMFHAQVDHMLLPVLPSLDCAFF